MNEQAKYNDDLPGHEYRIADYEERSERIQREVIAEKLGIAPQDVDIDGAMPLFSKAERWKLGSDMTDRFFAEVEDEIAAEYPKYSKDEIRIEQVTRMYGPTLGARFGESLKQKRAKETNEHLN